MKAIVGPDGSGKSTIIEKMKDEGNIISSRHAMPLTRWMKVSYPLEKKWYYVLKEFLNGIERTFIYIIVRVEKPDVLDRCVIDALSYSQFWADKCKCKPIYNIAQFFTFNAPFPDEVMLLRVLDRAKWNPKRNDYSWKDLNTLFNIYINKLTDYGYRIVDKEEYGLGEIWHWKRINPPVKSTYTSYRVRRKMRGMKIKMSTKYRQLRTLKWRIKNVFTKRT